MVTVERTSDDRIAAASRTGASRGSEGPSPVPTAASVLDAIVRRDGAAPVDLGPGDLSCVEAAVAGADLLLVRFDYAAQHGSIGTREADQLVAALRRARESGRPIVLLMETSGIRVTDGTAGIASLRRILREAADARLDGIRMLAMILKSAFGGASLLAALCECRVLNAGCLFAMSGPKLIEQSVGRDRFRADDAAAVRGLMGGAARATASRGFVLVEPAAEAYSDALVAWLRAPGQAPPTLAALSARLPAPLADPMPVPWGDGALGSDARAIALSVHPRGFDLEASASVLVAHGRDATATRVVALVAPEGAGARDALALARELVADAPPGGKPERSIVLVDAQSHAATPEDERPVLSEALAHLALTVRALHRDGRPVSVIVTGHGGGGIQGVLGGGATSVSMTPGARLFVLPRAAMRALNKSEDPEAGSVATALAVGAIDHAHPPQAPAPARGRQAQAGVDHVA